MGDGLARELRELEPPAAPVEPPMRDVRAGSVPLLKGVLRFGALRRGGRVLVLATLDVAGMFLAIWTALAIKAAVRAPGFLDGTFDQAREYAPLACLVMLLLFARSGLYRDRGQRPGFATVISGLFQVTLIVLLYAVIEGHDFSSYYIFYGTLFFALVYVSAFRWAFERISGTVLRAAGYRRRAVLVGSGAHIDAVAHALRDNSEVEPFGYVSLTPREADGRLRDFGTLDGLERNFDAVDEVLIADPAFPQDQAVELVDRCHEHGKRVRVAPSTMEILMDRVEFIPGQSLPLFELKPPVFEGVDFVVKRAFDLVGSVLLLLVLSPLLLAIAVAVKLDSRGPVLFRSRRPGIGGRTFDCLKFRTMEEGAERRQPALEHRNEAGGAIFKIRSDPRVTRVGALLRRLSLDELPQLLNVVRGEMSLVGPRPLPQRDYELLEEWHRKRYLVLPGMTGLWQVSGRSELDFDELVRLDFLYLERWSVFLDFTILLKTIPAILRSRGAW
jgi:exopolysaccharide biosynthesis polyprenyl glycosylphosphotransferase